MNNQADNNREPAIPERESGRGAIEPEIMGEEDNSWSSAGSANSSYKRKAWGTYRTYMGRTITFAPIDNTGCMAALITLTIFFACLFQWGLLAAIGFLVFHTIGSAICSIHSARQLVRGLPYNIWSLRLCNWIVSFFITAWLAGGFE